MKNSTETPRALLLRVRTTLDLSQEQMAKKLGMKSARTYQRYETGETEKVPAAVVQRAQALLGKRRAR